MDNGDGPLEAKTVSEKGNSPSVHIYTCRDSPALHGFSSFFKTVAVSASVGHGQVTARAVMASPAISVRTISKTFSPLECYLHYNRSHIINLYLKVNHFGAKNFKDLKKSRPV